MTNKKHWYCFVFTDNGTTASSMAGYDRKVHFSIANILEQKFQAGVTKGAVLLNIIYLGRMTIEEFKDEVQS